MGNGQLSQDTRSRVAEDGRRMPRIPAPIVEPVLLKPIYGKEVFRFLSRMEISCKTLLFLEGLMIWLAENQRTFMLKPNGSLSVCHFKQKNIEFGKVGDFSESFDSISSISIDTKTFGMRWGNSYAEMAFDFLLSSSSVEDDLLDAFLDQEDLEAMDNSNRFIFTLSPTLSLRQVKFLSEELTSYYLDVEGIRRLRGIPPISFLWKEESA